MKLYVPAQPGFAAKVKFERGFTLVELLVVISVISLLMSIMVPALGKIRLKAKSIMSINNQRQTVLAANCFTMDNDEWYPPSVATRPSGNSWGWQEPMFLAAKVKRPKQQFRSMSGYLSSYLDDARVLVSPSAPKQSNYDIRQVWSEGDDWSHPESLPPPQPDLVSGTYCFYWGYVGNLGSGKAPFRGPITAGGNKGYSRLLMTDYFGYGHWRNSGVYDSYKVFGSSEKLDGASITPGTICSADFWSRPERDDDINQDTFDITNPDAFNIKLHAGYTDGHVETYLPSETVPMTVGRNRDLSRLYPMGVTSSPGVFYLPKKAIRR